jgi:hypothetical protein
VGDQKGEGKGFAQKSKKWFSFSIDFELRRRSDDTTTKAVSERYEQQRMEDNQAFVASGSR